MTEGKSGSAWASCLRFSERHALRGAIDAHDAFLVEAVLVGGADVLDGGVLLGGGLVENHQHGRGLLGDDAAAVAPLAVALEHREAVGKARRHLLVAKGGPLRPGDRRAARPLGARVEPETSGSQSRGGGGGVSSGSSGGCRRNKK